MHLHAFWQARDQGIAHVESSELFKNGVHPKWGTPNCTQNVPVMTPLFMGESSDWTWFVQPNSDDVSQGVRDHST